jgi:hypothetical protein
MGSDTAIPSARRTCSLDIPSISATQLMLVLCLAISAGGLIKLTRWRSLRSSSPNSSGPLTKAPSLDSSIACYTDPSAQTLMPLN